MYLGGICCLLVATLCWFIIYIDMFFGGMCYLLALVCWFIVYFDDLRATELMRWARECNPMEQHYYRMSQDLTASVGRTRICARVLFCVGTLIIASDLISHHQVSRTLSS